MDRVDGLEATYPQIIEVLGDLSGLYVRARFTNVSVQNHILGLILTARRSTLDVRI